MSEHIPSRPFVTVLRTGEKLEIFSAAEEESALRTAEMNTAPRRRARIIMPASAYPKKKDPRTFIGWALKAFFD